MLTLEQKKEFCKQLTLKRIRFMANLARTENLTTEIAVAYSAGAKDYEGVILTILGITEEEYGIIITEAGYHTEEFHRSEFERVCAEADQAAHPKF